VHFTVGSSRRVLLSCLVAVCALVGAAGAAPSVGARPPALSVASWHNTPRPLSLEQLRGHVVLLDFWGVWCSPCRAEMPQLVALHDRLAARGLVVLTVHTPQKATLLPAYLAEHRLTLPVAVDTGETARAYGVDAFPTHILIDAAGYVVGLPDEIPSPVELERLLAAATP